MSRPLTSRWARLVSRPDRGAGGESLELVIIAPALIFLILVCVALGRVSIGSSSVDQAAIGGARAASLQRDPTAAQDAAVGAVTAALAQAGMACQAMTVVLDSSGFAVPMGLPASVSVTVECTVSWSDLAIPGLPGSRLVTATAAAPLDISQERFG